MEGAPAYEQRRVSSNTSGATAAAASAAYTAGGGWNRRDTREPRQGEGSAGVGGAGAGGAGAGERQRCVLEDFTACSKSHLWKLMMSFYDRKGVESWSQVCLPFTSLEMGCVGLVQFGLFSWCCVYSYHSAPRLLSLSALSSAGCSIVGCRHTYPVFRSDTLARLPEMFEGFQFCGGSLSVWALCPCDEMWSGEAEKMVDTAVTY